MFANRIFEIRNRNVERNRAATQRQAPASNGGANVQPSRGNVRPVQARVDYKPTSAYVEMRERYSQKLRYLLGLQQHYAASGNAYGVNRSQARIADLEKKFRLESIALAAVNQ
ncbi:MAG: hypothetical protein LBM19_03075 [Holosporales bacterium]|nr:hypothetical protein [Holosporales bacterium]